MKPDVQRRACSEGIYYAQRRKQRIHLGAVPALREENPDEGLSGDRPRQFSVVLSQMQTGNVRQHRADENDESDAGVV